MVRNNTPSATVAEEIIIEGQTQQQVIQEILNRFKQPIPANFVKLETEGRNYMCSTTGWKEPACERYGFFFGEERKWIQIDITHELMETLEIIKGEDITYPLYLSPDTLKKELVRGAITIENEEEMFIDKPVSKKNSERELVKRLEELKGFREKVEGLEKENKEKDRKIDSLEERLKKSCEELLQIQQMNQQVYDILGEYSNKTGLLLRSQEVVQKLKNGIPPMDWETTTTSLKIDNSNKHILEDKEWGLRIYKNLTTLNCYDNQLTSLPTLPASLTYLNCNSNQLTSLPTLPASLKFLNCQNNQLTSLPTLPASLTYLCCQNNQLTSLPTLPASLTNLCCQNNPNLKNITIDINKLPNLNNQSLAIDILNKNNRVINCNLNPNLQIYISEKSDCKPWKEWAAMPEYKNYILP